MIRSSAINILVANPPEDVNGVSWWRMFEPLRLLTGRHSDIQIQFNRGQLLPSDFYFSDILLCFRPCNSEHVGVIASAKEHGCRVIVDYDDDLLNIPVGNPTFNKLYDRAPIVNQCVAMSDAVWVSTPALNDSLRAANHNFLIEMRRQAPHTIGSLYKAPEITTIKNAVYPEMVPARANGNTKRAAWRGSDLYREDLEMWRPQYNKILHGLEYFQWIGYMPTWANVQGHKIDYKVGVKILDWFEYLLRLKLSILCKPVVPDAFGLKKSNIAFIEATCAGAICLTNLAGEPDWELCTKELPKLDDFYEHQWKKSAEAVKENYDINRWNEARYASVLKIMNDG